MTDAPCKWSEENQKALSKAIQSQQTNSSSGEINQNIGVRFNANGELEKNAILTSTKGTKIFSCEGNVSDSFKEDMYQMIVKVSKENGLTPVKNTLCTIVGFKVDGLVTFDIGFWDGRSSLERCYTSSKPNCEFNNVTNLFNEKSNKALVMVTNLVLMKQETACLDLKSGVTTRGYCQ